MRHAGLTCGFVNGFDRAGMLSGSPGTIDGRAQASQHWARLLLICLLAFGLGLLSLDISHARPAHDPMNYKLHAYNKLKDWKQFECIVELYTRESNWRVEARNYSHYGIPQGRSRWLATANGYQQVNWGIRYIKNRYETPCRALAHFHRKGWH
jgi:hypothetical protein